VLVRCGAERGRTFRVVRLPRAGLDPRSRELAPAVVVVETDSIDGLERYSGELCPDCKMSGLRADLGGMGGAPAL